MKLIPKDNKKFLDCLLNSEKFIDLFENNLNEKNFLDSINELSNINVDFFDKYLFNENENKIKKIDKFVKLGFVNNIDKIEFLLKFDNGEKYLFDNDKIGKIIDNHFELYNLEDIANLLDILSNLNIDTNKYLMV